MGNPSSDLQKPPIPQEKEAIVDRIAAKLLTFPVEYVSALEEAIDERRQLFVHPQPQKEP